MKVLITGGAGYIGSHCNRYFSKKGIETVILDNLSFGHKEAVQNGTLIVGDIGDNDLLQALFEKEKFDAVVHFAALADISDSIARPQLYYDTNVSKMDTLLKVMVKNGVLNVIFSSSAAVYGNPTYLPLDEKHSLAPINPYGATKLEGERLLQRYEESDGIRHVSLRYFNAAGADPEGGIGESHKPEHHLLPLIFQAILHNEKPLQIYGSDYSTKDGTCVRDYIHVMDLAKAHYLALSALMNKDISGCFNLGSNTGFTILEMIEACERITGSKVKYTFSDRRPGDPAILLASNEKIRKSLDWKPSFSSIENIINTAWEWERNRHY